MLVAVGALSALLLALAFGQLPGALMFGREVLGGLAVRPEEDACPPALVVVPLRGADPTLPQCLAALFRQDYPSFEVRVVVDSRDDPAWGVVRSVLAEHPAANVRVQELRTRRETCSLKCSSLLQAVSDLPEGCAFVAQTDADVVPHPTWLRELAGGFRDPGVGVVTGHRWYVPSPSVWGGVVRWIWNAGAVPIMYAFDIAWGGTMAVRATLLRSADLRERWARALSEDTALAPVVRAEGLDLRFVPSLMMMDQGGSSLADVTRWVRRQLLCVRLHHPAWPVVLAHGLLTFVVLVLVAVLGAVALAVGEGPGAAAALGAILGYEAVMLGTLLWLDRAVRRRVRRRGESPPSPTVGVALRSLPALPLTQAVHAGAVVAASFARRVSWRGVRYGIERGREVRLVEDAGAVGVGGD